jgi:hypothetical protein
MVVGGAGGDNSVLVDRTEYKVIDDGINIVIYDNLLGKVIDSVGLDPAYAYGMIR